MTIKHNTLFASLLALATPAAFAAETAEIHVTGTITPAACDITGGGETGAGTIATENLKQDEVSYIGYQLTRDITVTCSSPTAFTLRAIDNQPDTAYEGATNPDRFGLGTNGTAPIGYWTIALTNPTDPAGLLRATHTNDAGATWSSNDRAVDLFTNSVNHRIGFTTEAGAVQEPSALDNLNVTASMGLYIAPAGTLDLSGGIDFNGSATIQLDYL
jgi:type 1 fimbria pilin